MFVSSAAPYLRMRPEQAQYTPAETAPGAGSAAILSVVRWNGSMPGSAGRTVEMRFALYQDQTGGEPLWSEKQTVKVDADGRYTVLLGATTPEGMPQTLFQGGEARWIETRVAAGGADSSAAAPPRSLLAMVPYAFKSVDSETLGGRAAADYVTREDLQSAVAAFAASPEQVHPDGGNPVTGAGTNNYVPVWTGAATLGNSPIVVSGANVGIGTPAPVYPLDVNGIETLRGGLKLETNAVATPKQGVDSSSIEFETNTYSSVTQTAVPQYFIWQADSTGDNTANPSAILALSTSSGSATPTQTGFSFGLNGLLNFAAGQTFPGTGPGTVTGVTAGIDLTGGGTTGNVTLNVDTNKVVTGVTAGTGLTGGGTGGTPALAVDTTAVPLLASNNIFTGGETFKSEIEVMGTTGPGGSFTGGGAGFLGEPGVTSTGGSNAISGVLFGGPGFSGTGGGGTGEYGYQGGGDGMDASGGTSTALGSGAGAGATLTGGSSAPGILGGAGLNAMGGKGETGGDGVFANGGGAVVGCTSSCTAGAGGVFNGGGGAATNGGDGIMGLAGDQGGVGVVGEACNGYSNAVNCTVAGEFLGDVNVMGSVSNSGGAFKIDHPLDPANKYLYHSFVESPEMKNVYDGTIVTGGDGLATVTMPDWFEALNSDFRYQLTVIGQFAQAIVASEIANNAFTIRTDKPNVKVSWQVTGIRQDAWAKAHRIPVEVEKDRADQSHYLHPELFGHAGEPSIGSLHHPRPRKRARP
jgi:trimeric autotransporter adhesin